MYHKIDTVFKRDESTRNKSLLIGQYSRPEFEYLAENRWIFTEKVDGTNVRVSISDAGSLIHFGGKTEKAQLPGPLTRRLEELFLRQRDKLREIFPDGAVLYGEGYGEKIQTGGIYRREQDFVLFDVQISGLWSSRKAVQEIASNLGLDVIPVVGYGTLPEMVEKVRVGFTSAWGDFLAEGIVARPEVELLDGAGRRVICKIKHRDSS